MQEAFRSFYSAEDESHQALFEDLAAYHKAQPFEVLVEEEAGRLHSIFNAASGVLGGDERTADYFREIFMATAMANRSIILNRPLVVSTDDFGVKRQPRDDWFDQDRKLPKEDWSYLLIGGKYDQKSYMLGSGSFGFITVYPRKRTYTTAHPYVAMPEEFLSILDCAGETGNELMDSFSDLSMLINHDWLHSCLATTASCFVTRIPFSAPIEAIEAELDFRYRDYPDALQSSDGPYESMHMRFQVEALQYMAQEIGNVLEEAVSNYVQSWKEFKTHMADLPKMDEIPLTPVDYALRLLAFNLVRAVPFEHAMVQDLLADEDIAPHRAIFEDMYSCRMSGVLFGCGVYKKRKSDPIPQERECDYNFINVTTKDYRDGVLKMVGNSLVTAYSDAQRALEKAGELSHAKNTDNSKNLGPIGALGL